MSLHAPAAEAPLFVACYDISDDRERRRVDGLLQGYGFRVQKSIFECRLAPAALRRLRQQIERLALRTGHIKLYRVYAGAAQTALGEVPDQVDTKHAYVVQAPG